MTSASQSSLNLLLSASITHMHANKTHTVSTAIFQPREPVHHLKSKRCQNFSYPPSSYQPTKSSSDITSLSSIYIHHHTIIFTLSKVKGKGKSEHLYSALYGIQTTLKRSGMDHTVLPAINTMPAVYLVSVHQFTSTNCTVKMCPSAFSYITE